MCVALSGFDQVFLELVISIKTEQDRLDAITELQSFIVRNIDFDGFVVLVTDTVNRMKTTANLAKLHRAFRISTRTSKTLLVVSMPMLRRKEPSSSNRQSLCRRKSAL